MKTYKETEKLEHLEVGDIIELENGERHLAVIDEGFNTEDNCNSHCSLNDYEVCENVYCSLSQTQRPYHFVKAD